MPQPVSYNPGTPVSGSIQENSISYVVDGQNRNYRGGFGGLSWMSEVPAENNVIFIGNSTSLGRGPANIPLFYPSYNNSSANIVYAANTLPGSPRNFTTTGSAYNWAATNNFFINNSDNPIPRIDADGLVLYLDANQPTSYPQTGTSWYDVSGFGNNGSLINGPTFNSSLGTIFLDGVDDFVTCSITNIAPTTFNNQDITFEMLCSTTTNDNAYHTLMSVNDLNYPSGNYAHITLGQWRNGLQNGSFYWQIDTTVQSYLIDSSATYTSTNIATGKFFHVVGTWSKNGASYTGTLYVNGTSVASSNSAISTYTASNATKAYIGSDIYNSYRQGNINNSKIYSKALSLSEVKQNYFQSNIVTSSLSYLWDANNLVSYSRSGTNVYNLTGSISGSMTNGTGYTYNNGGSWFFDGTDDYILLENSLTSITPGNGNWTLSAWVKGPWNVSSFYPVVGNTSGGPVASGFAIYQNKIFYQNYDGNWNNHSGNTTLNTNTWYHVTWVNYEGASPGLGTMKMYVNGVVDSSTFNSYVTNGGPVNAIGAAYNGIYSGNIASVQWNIGTAFSDQQVIQQYEATKDKFQGQQIVTNGLVLNLDAANKDSYPGTGTTWTDLSGNGYNGTLVNGPSFLSNQNGGIFNFDYVDDYVSIGNNLGSPSTFTLNAWVRSSNIAQDQNIFNGNPPFFLRITSSTIRCAVYTGTWIFVNGSITLSSNTWYNLVLVYDQSTVKGYVNGVLDVNSVKTGTPIYGALNTLGFTTGGEDAPSVTNIAVAQVYNRALSATEVTQNYNAQKTRFGL